MIKPMKKYYCCLCHREIERNYRLVVQQFGEGRLGDFGTIRHLDFCDKHFYVFDDWIKKFEIKGDKK